MRVLIFHAYLLRGTGSNVYNASLAQALARIGHEVHLLCQDRRADELGWVGGEEPGTVTVHVPEIGGLLPVFVADRYEGFEVKTFPELTTASSTATSPRTWRRSGGLWTRSEHPMRCSPTT